MTTKTERGVRVWMDVNGKVTDMIDLPEKYGNGTAFTDEDLQLEREELSLGLIKHIHGSGLSDLHWDQLLKLRHDFLK